MSGGPPPHHPHNRQVPAANTAWNHLQVPNFFPTRQPQHAHMSNEHPLLHQPTWHTPTTEPMKTSMQHSHLFNLEQMLSDRPFPRHSPGVDLSVTRNGSQNGDLPTTPISLSVRDTNKINSLTASALDIQGTDIKSLSPGLKSHSPGLISLSPGLKSSSPGLKSISPGLKSTSPGLIRTSSPALVLANPGLITIAKPSSPGIKTASSSMKPASPNVKTPGVVMTISPSVKSTSPITKSTSPVLHTVAPVLTEKQCITKPQKKVKSVDLILERLNPQVTEEKQLSHTECEKPQPSVIVQATSSHDENSNSSSILNVPTPTAIREDDVVSPYSNEDSLDSNKSRRKRKPSKTIRVATKEAEPDPDPPAITEIKGIIPEVENEKKIPERRKSQSPERQKSESPERQKSESPEPVPRKTRRKTSSESETIDKIAAMVQETATKKEEPPVLPTTETEIFKADPITSEVSTGTTTVITLAQKKDFVAVEDKLEEMFAGLEDPKPPADIVEDSKCGFNDTSELLNLANTPSTSHDNVTSTSNDLGNKKSVQKKRKVPKKNSDLKKKKNAKKAKMEFCKKANSIKKVNGKAKVEVIKDIYAYDSGSNTSSTKSRGPFVQIRGPRDSPLSVSVINTPVNEEDSEKKLNKSKKFHDDTEYRHKVRSKGLHCSTLSNKYDAQTKDATWICVFCKRGPYTSEFTSSVSFYTPGDLFGPYVITNKCAEYERRMEDPYDKQFKSKKICRTLEGGVVKTKKSKRKNSESVLDESDINHGIAFMDDGNYEIWAHEDCIVWSPGIYLVGPKIVGLEEAVWTCSNVNCSYCHFKGANVCCLKRGCISVVHLGCAFISNWQLDDENYKAYCSEHRIM